MFGLNKKSGFTLAEVLITLGIIGIIAEITIPSLYHDFQEQNFKVAYKKAYSVASQAWGSAYADNMMEPRNGWESNLSNYDNFNLFMSKFSIIKKCTSTTGFSDCWAPNETNGVWFGLPFSQNSNANEICFIDKSGMSWCNMNTWGAMVVDTNGPQKPNIYGKDRFGFWLSVNNQDVNTGVGVPNVVKPTWDQTTHEDTYCPAAPKHFCLSTGWLYN